jgi:hypothetical protein
VKFEGELWRFIAVDKPTLNKYLKRKTFSWEGKLTSTTIDESVAASHNFVYGADNLEGVIFRIQGRGLAVNDLGKLDEFEVIQSGKSRFKVVGQPTQRENGVWQINLEQLQ